MAEETPENSLKDPPLELEVEDVDKPIPLIPRPVVNGFQLKQKSQTLPFKTLTYAPVIVYKTKPNVVDWQLLALYHIEGSHIRIHELQEGEDLRAAIDEYKSTYAKAVVIINTKESLILSKEVVNSLQNIGQYLVAVLSRSDGDTLLDCLQEQFEDEDVFARLEVVSSKATPLAVLGEDSETAVLEIGQNTPPVKSESHSTKAGFGGLTKLFGSRPVFDLKTEIKKVMFEGDSMLAVSSDAGLFTVVMSNFTQYEKVVHGKPDANQINEVIKKFLRYFESSFSKEFPFFLVLAYRLKKFRSLYECDELPGFTTKCIDMFEMLPPQQVVETLQTFIQKKDFDIMFGSEVANTSVFQLLATACRDFMSLSTQIKNSRPGNSAAKRFFYCRILWISVYLKCLGEKGMATRIEAGIWDNDLLISHVSRKTVIRREIIDDFKLGLHLSTMLQLPVELQFTTHHLSRFLADENFIRPLSHVRDMILSLESFIQSDRELLVHVVVNLRAHFTPFLHSPDRTNVGKASVEGTVLGVIDEGISFLDGMKELWNRKGWHKGPQHKDFRDECFNWMKLLLGTVRVTEPNAHLLLKKFLAPKRGSVVADNNFRNHIVRLIVEETKNSFPNLTVQMFFLLYKSFRIWPITFLPDYLKQYHIPSGVNISDATWTEFFNVVLERFQSEEPQNHLMEFLKSVAECYRLDERAGDFIPDILQLKVPLLFVAEIEPAPEGGNRVGDKFSSFLREYIQRNNLRPVIMNKIQDILGYVTDNEQYMFHWIVLNVLQSEVIPELKALQGTEKNMNRQLKDIIILSVNTLCQNLSWFTSQSARQKFCWGVVATGCGKIPITAEKFEWVYNLQYIITQLGVIFNTYCNSRKLHGQQCLLSEHMPKEVDDCPWDDVRRYFHWVRHVQDLLCVWQNKFLQYRVNYDEIMEYASNNVPINALGRAVCANSYVMEMHDISEVKKTFVQCFEQLNVYLLRYVPNNPDVKYCTLPELLNKYGVSLTPELQDAMYHKIIFPGEHKVPIEQRLHNVLPHSASGVFEPGQDIGLMLTKSFSLYDLQSLLDHLYSFLRPVIELMDMFVFFHLHGSVMFEKHMLKHLQELTATSPQKKEKSFSLMPSFMPAMSFAKRDQSVTRDKEGVSISTLQKALLAVKTLLLKVVKGTATYSDIIADGALQLESLDTKAEFGILTRFSESLEMNRDHCEGLEGVRCMLELFQFIHHIDKINSVCHQYGLTKCLEDETLKELMIIVEELKPEKSRAMLTPLDAMEKMRFMKQALCLDERTSYNCLDLFPAVADSAAFYQFIRDKQFVGTRGQTIFREQYQLITAQLQHEEYDENVLNHLRAAFEFIAPFMEQDISFTELMGKVVQLETTHGLKQLETVNENITLIRLWFSRAEGDTIENVANELEHILSTGLYQFQMSNDQSNILLIYQSLQGARSHRRTTSNTPLEESEEKLDSTAKLMTLPTVYPSPQPMTIDTRREESPFANTMGSVEQRWTSEQIADFVRKLGFLGTEKEGGDKIKLFLHLNSTANKLLELFMKLHELGHPHYQKYRNLPVLLCNTLAPDADAMVDQIEQTLLQWTEKVSILRQKYSWLLFFSVPKLLHLHSLLDDIDIDLDAIIREVMFLFENDLVVRRKLKPVIQKAIKEIQENLQEDNTPMQLLGEFLELICSCPDLKPFLLKQRSSRRESFNVSRFATTPFSPTTSGAVLGMYQLHYAPGYTQSQLLCLITELFDGVPEPFEVFYCRPTTTREELKMFMERVKHHPLPYLILQVNKLPFKLQELLMSLLKYHKLSGESNSVSTVHFIETSPSVLREVPWITYREHKEGGHSLSFDNAARIFRRKVLKPSDFSCIQLIFGHAGDGKTHYIRQQLHQSPARLTIAVNEAFTPLNAIKSLNTLPHNTNDCAVFFNFTLMMYQGAGQDEKELLYLKELMDTIGWFFFNFLVLGYVEDPSTGASFRLPGGQEWAIYIEVPSLDHTYKPEESLHMFCKKVPTLGLLGSPHVIHPATPYAVDQDVQLVCKYLNAYKIGGTKGIDRLYREMTPAHVSVSHMILNKKVKFSKEDDLTEEACHSLLLEFMPEHILNTKITQKLFIRYMKRRCEFLDSLPAFNYNTGIGEPIQDEAGRNTRTDTRQLGSTLMKTMIEEVSNFCDPAIKRNWSEKPHQQLIYDFRDGGGSFGLMSLHLENLPEENRRNYKKIGFELHSGSKLQDRKILDQHLARALGLPSEPGKRLSVIDDSNYVLTLDYTIKMLNIHERYECGVPVIIKGETGVGKTALVDMLSRLWGHALLHLWNKERGTILDAIRDLMSVKAEDSLDNYQTCLEIVEAIACGREVSINDLIILGQLSDSTTESGLFYSRLRTLLLDMATNPAVALLKLSSDNKGKEDTTSSLDDVFQLARTTDSPETTASLLLAVLKAKIKNTFHKLNVHAALTPTDIKKLFEPVFEQGKRLQAAYINADESKKTKIKMPFVTVFLDEVNTSSCLGLFKEIIVDRTIDGESIPDNIFIVAACNPHRGNSMATHAEETWLRSSYYVRPLHPTLEYLIWDYGSLDQYQEGDYIRTKMQMLHRELPNIEVVTLTDLIVESQSLMRRYAYKQLIKQRMKPEDAEVSSHSCVSQRDIQRVFTFYQWLMSIYHQLNQHGERTDYSRRAVMVSLGIVYYMRLNSECREEYRKVLDNRTHLPGEVNFWKAFREELDWFCSCIELPPGIAKTQALKENLFATIVCTVTHTPLIIVGAPGSSKTLSFNLAIANLKGPESKMQLFRKVDIFKSLDPHFYQCSRRTTSNEIQTVFSRAINRQRSHAKFSLPIYCVVFMDEAGLPEESHESLKVLHYHLDKQEVSFVAITNHVLDAAKTNRAVSLFRPEVSHKDLETLAKGCLCSTPDNPPPEIKNDLGTIVQFCQPYSSLMECEKLNKFFGLRDFIHFINYLRRRRTKGLTPQLVMEALERNFNGVYWTQPGGKESFEVICQSFLNKMPSSSDEPISLSDVNQRSILEILQESLLDRPERGREENEVRYKLIIDPSEDNSLMHLLITFGVLERKKTRIYVCSDFPGDGQIQKINTIAAIRHSAIEGHTVVMSQTDDIHESFYDLFNQRFRRIDDPEHGPRYYANIAIGAHLRPCRVHPDFVCVVVVRQSEVEATPAPFLNRFEKYCISHETLLQTTMNHLQPCIRIVLQTAKEKVKQFIDLVGGHNSLYGLKKETLDSLLLSLLPPYGHTYKETPPGDLIGDDVNLCLLQELLRALRNSAGFAVPVYQLDELETDAEHLFPLIQNDAAFDGILPLLTIDSAHEAVTEAMHVLHTAPGPNEGVVPREMSQEACLVVSILQHWLIRHLCKRLMQLMTPEAVSLHRKQIPASLIDNYLSHQQHFSLKKLIDHHQTALESCQGDTFLCANKLLCFTRSSPIIHQIPTKYPSIRRRRDEPQDDTEDTTLLKELVCEDPNLVKVCKISSVQSQSVIHEVLRDFIRSPNQKILLLLANMQEATCDMINHLRVMIEETEAQVSPTHHKLYVLLLHFPPAMFFDSCYPSLFLRGWNHYYLDSIGHSPTLYPGTIDIEEWFQRCCFPKKEFPEDSLMKACNRLLVDVIPVLASHVSYGTRSHGPFTRTMKAVERCNKLKELLIDKRVGKILCKLFRNSWRPHVMVEHLERAATFTQSQDSSLNITDAVQAMFQSYFTDFMVVMVTRINKDRNLDVLFTPDCNPVLESLFLSLLETFSSPKLAQLKILAVSLIQPKPQEYQPVFPFFSIVYNGIEQLIEEGRKVKGHQEDLLEERSGDETQPSSQPQNPESGMRDLAVYLKTTIEQGLEDEGTSQDPVYISIKYLMNYSNDLWNRYFSDFMYHSLHIDIVTSSLSCKILEAFFSEILELPLLQKIIFLHTYVDYNKISLANLSSLLRPLEKIWQVAAGAPHTLTDGESSSPVCEFIKAVQETKHPFGDPQMLSVFVISALFSALVGAVFPKCEKDEEKGVQIEVLRIWYQTYLRVMSMPALKSHLYVTLIPANEEAMFNIMHSTFIMIHIHQTPDEDILIRGGQVFTTLLSKYFKTNLKLKESRHLPRLSECADVTGEMMIEVGQASISSEMSRRLQEELFSHFFSQYRVTYSDEDRDWFLKLANTQYTWKASTQIINESVVSSSYSGDLVSALEESIKRRKPQLIADVSSSCVSITTYKMCLSRILGHCKQSAESAHQGSGPLLMYNAEARHHIATVLSEGEGDQTAGPYIPTFYQDCRAIRDCRQSENLLMQQPLCHLYFFTLMEHLLTEPRDVNSLVRIAGTISQLYRPQTVPLGNKIILHIEKQAVLQCLLREVALVCSRNTNQPTMTKELTPVMVELNVLLDDDSTGGGMIGGHRLTLGMHLLHNLRSDRRFTDLFTTRYQAFKEIKCLGVFHQQLRTQPESKPYLFPFMQVDDQHSALSKLYQQVRSAMLQIDESRGSQAAVDQLLKVAEECISKPKMSKPHEAMKNIDRRQAFKMMVWLVTYYDFFFPKRTSQPMCLVVGKQLKPYIKDEGVVRLIQSFLHPRWLIENKESPMPLREDAQMLRILPDGRIQRRDYGGKKVDPLYEMFIPSRSAPPRDQSDIDLCHCLANLVGVVLGCQPQSNHLWYHLFSPNELKHTYMTGFMYDSKISPEGLLYDCGVELTAEGQYGRPDYHKHATRGTYSLHSLYFLLWANFGTFCISMLTQPDSQSKIHGPIISEWQAIRHYCVSQVKTMWMYLRNNLSLSDEERSFLVTRCLMNMYEINMDSSANSLGKLRTKEEQDGYETEWHSRIYTPAWEELHTKFVQYSVLWQNQVFMNIRQLEACYPQFPDEKEFLNHIQGLGLEDGDLRILSRFGIEKQRLEVGGRLLPGLIQLYQWLHTHLSHLVTMDRAYNKLNIGRVIQLASRRVDPSLQDLYNRVKEQYNQYVELVGGAIGQGACAAVRRGNRIYTIADDLPLVHFLSDFEEEGEGNDWLYAVIRDIAEAQNLFVQTLYAGIGENERNNPLARLLLSEVTHIYPAEANEHSCIVGRQQIYRGLSDFLQLVRSRQEQSSAYRVAGSPLHTSVKLMSLSGEGILPRPSLSFNLNYLQEDIVSIYLAGRPIIEDVSSLRSVFKFRQEKTASINTQPSDPMGAASDLTSLKDMLPPSFRSPLCADLARHLEYEFHSANYHTLTDVVVGLRTSLGHLIKVLPLEGGSQVTKVTDDMTLQEFMLSQYETEEEDSNLQVFSKIGIKNLSDTQLARLSSVKLCFLLSTLELFVRWVKEGLYDFNSLPMALKVHLIEEDIAVLEQLPKTFQGTSSQLLVELKGLIDALLHVEAHLIKEVNEQAQKPLIGLLQTLCLVSDTDKLPGLIPNTVLVHQYVHFRMVLRRITSIVEQRVAMETSMQSKEDNELWTAYVDDLWSTALPHLRDEGVEFIDPTLLMNSTTGRYGFDGEEWDDESVSELDGDLNKDSSESYGDEDSIPSIFMDYDDPLLYQEQVSYSTLRSELTLLGSESSVRETLKRGLEDPELREEMLRMITKKKDIEQQAKDWSPQMVCQFLEGIGMKEHTKTFLKEAITGSQLLTADREVYQELGVTSTIHCVQIAVKFKRALLPEERLEYSLRRLLQTHANLAQYEKKFEQARVEVEMLLFAQENDFIAELLKELGINKALDRNRIEAGLKEISASSTETKGYVAYSTPV